MAKLRTVACAICGDPFQTAHSQGKYCSSACSRVGERASWNKYGQKNSRTRKLYGKDYYQKNKDAVIARIDAYHQSEAGKRAAKISDQRQREKFPEKYAARQAVHAAINRGELVRRPCAHCGAGKAQAHHHDYSKPLEVEWLCRACHDAEHRAHRSGTVGFVMVDGHVRGHEPPPAAETVAKKDRVAV